MADIQFPAHVEAFIERTGVYLEHFEIKLELTEIDEVGGKT